MTANPPPPSIRPRSIAQSVFELLRADIVFGVLKPLDPIREAEVAERLGVSRTPVREALLRLQGLGLVEIFPQSGTRVAPIRPEKVRAAQLIGEAVEVEVVRQACRTAPEEAFDRLGYLIEDQATAARRNDVRRLFELDDEFHRAIHEAAGLGAVPDELDTKVHLDRLRSAATDAANGADRMVTEHGEILAALRQRNETAAADAMTRHQRAVLAAIDRIAEGAAERG
jgi:DNA-binding GntR family transcriptional regulator